MRRLDLEKGRYDSPYQLYAKNFQYQDQMIFDSKDIFEKTYLLNMAILILTSQFPKLNRVK